MQNPVLPTTCSDSPRSQSSSVMLGTRQTMRGSALTDRRYPTPRPHTYMFRRYSPPTS